MRVCAVCPGAGTSVASLKIFLGCAVCGLECSRCPSAKALRSRVVELECRSLVKRRERDCDLEWGGDVDVVRWTS